MRHRFIPRFLGILLGAVAIAVVCAGSWLPGGVAQAARQQPVADISPEALAQIDALIQEKESRTSVQRKIDSQLIYAIKMGRGEPIASGVQTLATDLAYVTDGRLVLDVKADVTPQLAQQLADLGIEVVSQTEGTMRVNAPLVQIEGLAALPAVTFVQPKQEATTSRRQPQLQPNVALPTGQGSRSSEGDVTHLAFAARGAFGVNGTGLKIGVLSNGVTNLAASQALGDLGPVTVLPGQAGTGDEGTAMLEIIHDLAPGAQLFYATAIGGVATFANNIRGLRAAGCDIIVDDVFYFVETPFQDGQAPAIVSNTNGGAIIQAVNDVTADGAMYFSSAGNSGNLNDGTSGVWEGNFIDGGPTAPPLSATAGRLHLFGGQAFNVITFANTAAPVGLYWADPLGGSSNDYDLFILNPAGTAVAASSTNIQNGTQDPYEQTGQATNFRIVVVKKNGAADRFLHVNTNRGTLSVATAGQTHGHSHALNAFSTAATPAVGPFPAAFSGSNVVETFSSDGPRRIFFQADGTPYTPGNFSSTGGIVRQKPDITAADGTSVTGVGNFPSPFFGTSAAAPHAAAIAALLKSSNPALTPAQIRTLLTASAIDIEAAGVDRDSGAGIVMPMAALQASGAVGTAFLQPETIQATDNPGNGNGAVEAGEGARFVISLKNYGLATASVISANLTTTTPGITITQPSATTYPNLAASAQAPNASPLLFTAASDVACPLPADFTLTVSSTGGPNPQVFAFKVPIGPPTFSITTNLDTTPPPSSPGVTGSTGVQNARIFRDGIASACGTTKVFPGTTAPGNRQFDLFNFNTCSNSAPSCATVTVSGANAINLSTVAYGGPFNPANIGQNYKADAGSSAAVRTYSFDLAGGAQSFGVNIHDVPILAVPSGTQYTLSVAGACLGACAPPNRVPVALAHDVTVSAGPSCTAPASVNNGSFDPDGDPLTITQTPPGPYPLGTTPVLLTVTDDKGATAQASATVTVVDTTPPSVSSVVTSPSSNWPPNHKMFDVTVGYTVSDTCSAVNCVLSVTSNEPANGNGDGNTAVDWEIVDAHHVRLRSERAGAGSGRIYTITVTCTDSQGNVTTKTGTVTIANE